MTVFTAGTASSPGIVVINLYDVWHQQWVREWADLGELHKRRELREELHGHALPGWLGLCECFECRVQRAWEQRRGS